MSTPTANGNEVISALTPDNHRHGSDQTGLSLALTEVKEAGAALWKDVYENRKVETEAAAAVAVTALALYAGRGQLARLLPGAGKDVLLVEDTPYMGKAMKSALEANGEHVTWVTAVKRAAPLTGTTADGRDLILDPRRFKIALLDGELKGSYLQGEHVAHALHEGGLTSIGTSSVASVNDMMLINGAEIVAPKPTIVSALANNQLDLGRAVRSPGLVQQRLDQLTTELTGPNGRALRQRADQLLTKFISEETDL